MNPVDISLSTLVDSAFPIAKEIPGSMDYQLLFRLANLVVYGVSEKEKRMVNRDDE